MNFRGLKGILEGFSELQESLREIHYSFKRGLRGVSRCLRGFREVSKGFRGVLMITGNPSSIYVFKSHGSADFCSSLSRNSTIG